MNRDEMESLEELLCKLPLRRPSGELDQRVSAIWRSRPLAWKRLAWGTAAAAALAVAASLLVMWLLRAPGDRAPGIPAGPAEQREITAAKPRSPEPQTRAPEPPPSGQPSQGIYIEQLYSAPAATEVVIRDDALPMRRVHHQVMRHVRWIDDRQHVHIEWNIPGEETVLVPLEYN